MVTILMLGENGLQALAHGEDGLQAAGHGEDGLQVSGAGAGSLLVSPVQAGALFKFKNHVQLSNYLYKWYIKYTFYTYSCRC